MNPTTSQLAELARRDPALARAMESCRPFPGFPTVEELERSPFQYLAHTILYQQVSVKVADAIHARVCALTPGLQFPSPQELLALPDAELRGAGVSGNKTAALRDLAAHVCRGYLDFEQIADLPDEEVIETLCKVRGIGPWSAKMYLIFRLARPDVLAEDDIGLQEGLRLIDGLPERPTREQLLNRAEVWRRLRSVASWYLWRVAEAQKASKSRAARG